MFGGVHLLAFGYFPASADRTLPSVYAPSLKAGLPAERHPARGAAGARRSSSSMSSRPLRPDRARSGCGPTCCSPDPWPSGQRPAWASPLRRTIPPRARSPLLLGLGEAAFAPAARALLASEAPRERTAQAVSIFTAGSAGAGRNGALLIGGAVLALLAHSAVLGLAPWRAASLALVLPNLAVAFALLRWPATEARAPHPKSSRPRSSRARSSRPSAAGLGRRRDGFCPIRRAWGCTSSRAGAVLLVQASGAWAASILNRAWGLDPAASALAAGVVGLVGRRPPAT